MEPQRAKEIVDYGRLAENIDHELTSENKQELLQRFLKKEFGIDSQGLHEVEMGAEQRTKSHREFNHWFNEQFEAQRILSTEEATGYGEWLRSTDEPCDSFLDEGVGPHDLQRLEAKRRKMMIETGALQKYSANGGVAEFLSSGSGLGCVSLGGMCEEFDGGGTGVGQLHYQDLHKAHTETLLPVCEEDVMAQKHHFSGLQELKAHRAQQDLTPLSEADSNRMLQREHRRDAENAVQRAYELARQSETSLTKQKAFWNSLQLLTRE